MYNEEINWFNQTLLTYKDKEFGTDGYLRISFVTSTKDFINFNPIKFNITISNQLNKSCNLNIQQSTDLLSSIRTVIQNPTKIYNENNYQILKRWNNLELVFEFVIDQNSNSQVVRITLRSNENDFTKIIIPFNIFQVLSLRLKYFVDNYDNFCTSISNLFIQKEILKTNKQILNSLNSLPSKLIDFTNTSGTDKNNKSKENNSEFKKNIEISENTIEELDNFLGGAEMTNVKNISEFENIPSKQENIQEYNSKFFNCLDNNLENFEKILIEAEANPDPIIFITNKLLKDKMMMKNINNFNIIPDISENDLKSLLYISKLNCNITIRSNIEKGISIPSSIVLLKYKLDNKVDTYNENIELAFDLLMVNGYFRALRRKLESKIDDAMINKSIVYLILRNYTDMLTFSFLENLPKIDVIKTNIISRFKYYNRIGVFDVYKKLLGTYNCTDIIDIDIGNFIDEVLEKVIGKSPFIDELHKKLYNQGSVRLSYENRLSQDQIINEVIPNEINEKMGIKNLNDMSEEVEKIFSTKLEKHNVKINKKQNSNLYRLINQYRNEIPEKIRNDFLEMIQKLGDNPINFDDIKYSLETFGENIIKILYIWDPINDLKVLSNFKYLFEKFENEIMTKELILVKLKVKEDKKNIEQNNNEDWNLVMDL